MLTVVRSLYGAYVALVFSVSALSTWAIAAIIPGIDRRRAIARAGARTFFALAGLRIDVDGLGHLPAAPCLVVANHASYVDGVLMTAVLPPRFAFVIKNEMQSVALMGRFLTWIDSLFVERRDVQQSAADARRIMRAAKSGTPLAIFPEGTFKQPAGLMTFRQGAFRVAARLELPVIPVTITGTRKILPDGGRLPRFARIRVVIDSAVISGNTETLIAGCRQAILARLGEPDLDEQQTAASGAGRQADVRAP
ncbi:MAG: lysophospholipid acyltransferase family protein [Pseudomonadota bacterium]